MGDHRDRLGKSLFENTLPGDLVLCYFLILGILGDIQPSCRAWESSETQCGSPEILPAMVYRREVQRHSKFRLVIRIAPRSIGMRTVL